MTMDIPFSAATMSTADSVSVLMASTAVVSTLVALGALIISVVGLVRSGSAAKDAQAARQSAALAQWKMSEHLQVIAEAQAEAARAAHGAGQEPPTHIGGQVSTRLVRQSRHQRLVVANVGVETLTVEAVDVTPGDVLDEKAGAEIVGATLDPGEHISTLAGPPSPNAPLLTVRVRWHDRSGRQRERVQRIIPQP